MARMQRRHVLAATVAAAALLATGCSGDSGSGGTPQERLAAAQAKVEAAEAITIALTSKDVPSNVNGVQAATGTGVVDGETRKFEGEFQGRVAGVTATAGILAIDDQAWMKLFTPEYSPIDLDELGAPNPTSFFADDTGVASLLSATTDLSEGGQVREGREILSTINGSLPGEKVESLLRLGGPGTTFDVSYGLTEDDELRKAVLTGEFYEGRDSTYTLLLTDYGKTVAIEAPTS